jgi:hypothetical protein
MFKPIALLIGAASAQAQVDTQNPYGLRTLTTLNSMLDVNTHQP